MSNAVTPSFYYEDTAKQDRNREKTASATSDDTPSVLDWEDDGFSLLELDERLQRTKAVRKEEHEEKSDFEMVADGNVVEDWLKPIATKEAQDETTSSKMTDDEGYLTKQFKRLNTPASRKKPRCIICTRPLSEDREHVLVCDRHENK